MSGIDDSGSRVLLKQLVKSHDDMNEKMGILFDRIGDLVAIEAARAEREKAQQEKEREFEEFMKLNEEPLNRLRRWQSHIDGSTAKVVAALIMGIVVVATGNFIS